LRVADQSFERANVLVAKLGGEGDEILFAASARLAAWIRRLVMPLMAETTTATGVAVACDLTMSAARRTQSASPTEVPPNFMTQREEVHGCELPWVIEVSIEIIVARDWGLRLKWRC
jgi:hypothetical protein